MNDTMPSEEGSSDPEDGKKATGPEPRAEEELDDPTDSPDGAPGDTGDDGEPDEDTSGGPGPEAEGGGGGEGDQARDPELDKVAGSDPPDPKKLDELDEKIRQARSTAEDVVGTEESPIYTESGEEGPEADDQAITPPG